MYGKKIRLGRLFHHESNKTCIVPMDHGITIGPVDGLVDYKSTVKEVIDNGADAVILHRGLLKSFIQNTNIIRGGYILHLSASTTLNEDANEKVLVSTVEDAVKMGADGVSVHINVGIPSEAKMIKDLGMVSSACQEWGMPLLAMMYVRKENVQVHQIQHAVRIAEELGADIIKVDYPGSFEEMNKLINLSNVPIVIAGGHKTEELEKVLTVINNAMLAGAAGVAIGRNIFQHKDPGFITNLISNLVHGKLQFQECLYRLRSF